MKAMVIFIEKKQKQNKMSFSSSANSQYFFSLLSPGCLAHAQKGVKMHFCVFTPFLSLSDSVDDYKALSMPFASIYPTDPRINPWNFCEKNWELAELENAFFVFLFFGHWVFQFFSQWKSAWLSYEVSFISALWIVSSEYWKSLIPN